MCSRNRCTCGSPGSSTRTSGRWARRPSPAPAAPWEFQCSLPQWRTERILADRVVELGGTVERGVEAVSVRQREDGVLIGLKRADGTAETVEASWVIGAGGAHSVTRESRPPEDPRRPR
ncbi:MAG TPA: FAD-dependent monooxygenase [Trebonia sp.]|nr:FAD-dependent monooxygenase [Trebonia sp.]